jgi:type II secretory pathway component GspD/PulD (secretin)
MRIDTVSVSLLVLACVSLITPAAVAPAGAGTPDPVVPTVRIDVEGAPLVEVVRLVAEQAGFTMAGPSLPATPISIRFAEMPADRALDLILAGTPFVATIVGHHLLVHDAEEEMLRTYRLDCARALELAPQIQQIVSGAYATADVRTNSVLVVAPAGKQRMVADAIAEMDRPVPQVLIRADIVEVDLGGDRELGVNWFYALDQTSNGVNQDLTAEGNPLTSVTDFAFRYARLGTNEFRIFLGMLEEVRDTRILSSPRIMTASDRPAQILVGERVPYASATTETETGATLQQIEFIEVGILLEVTPHVGGGGVIHLTVHPEVSEVLDQAVMNVPRIGTREATAEVSVQSGGTIVLGGLKRTTKIKIERRLPILGSIPFIGPLFRSTSEQSREAELMVFLTPTIVPADGPGAAEVLQDTLDRSGLATSGAAADR